MGYRVSGEYAYVTTGDPDGNGVVHLREKGSIIGPDVDQSVIDHLVSVGLVEEFELDPEPQTDLDDGDDTGNDGDDSGNSDSQGPDLDAMNLDQLRKHAEEHSIDLAGATKKADIIAAIQAAHQ